MKKQPVLGKKPYAKPELKSISVAEVTLGTLSPPPPPSKLPPGWPPGAPGPK